MNRQTVLRRLRQDGYPTPGPRLDRIISNALNQPSRDRPAGAAGHRSYTELDYRKIVSYLRVHGLCGDDKGHDHSVQKQFAVEMLATHTTGYVYIADEDVGWRPDPPIGVLRGGVATCWPVWD